MDLSHVFMLVWICHYRFSFSRDINVLNHMPIHSAYITNKTFKFQGVSIVFIKNASD